MPLLAPGSSWLAVFAVAIYCLLTMSRDLSFYDSAELALVAFQGGLSHPPGHPLHAMAGWVLSHLPALPPLLGLNALSALPCGLMVLPAVSLAETLAGSSAQKLPKGFLPLVAGIVSVHPIIWECASRVEVYSLASFFALWSIAFVAARLRHGAASPAGWAGAGVGLGLCASVNPVVATAAALGLAPGIMAAAFRRVLPWKALPAICLGGAAGLLPYLYVPLVASRRGVFVWGAPLEGDALVRYFSGADFSHNQGATATTVVSHAASWLAYAFELHLLPVFALGLAGALICGGKSVGRGFLLITFGLCLLFISMNVIFYPEVTDYSGYMTVPFACAGAGAFALVARLASGAKRRLVLAGFLAAALVLDILLAPPVLAERTRHRDQVGRFLAGSALDHAPPDAVMIVSSDHYVFPLLYLQGAEGARPDVVVLARGLSGASWFWGYLYEAHPTLRPFPLRGPGGQSGRIRRFLAANPDRPVLFESLEHALRLGLEPGCVGPVLLHNRRGCSEPSFDELSQELASSLSVVGEGSPTTDAVIANVAFSRGEMLWHMGLHDEALVAFRAGVPTPLLPPLPGDGLSGAQPLRAPLPAFDDGHAIGHRCRNLFAAALLLRAASQEQAAQAHAVAAARCP